MGPAVEGEGDVEVAGCGELETGCELEHCRREE